jgi:hypothetical protein
VVGGYVRHLWYTIYHNRPFWEDPHIQLESRKKEMFSRYHPHYPWISGLTSGRGLMIQALSVIQWKHQWWILGWGKGCFPCRQSILQCPYHPYCRQGFVDGHGLGQAIAQCTGFPHWKLAPGAVCWILWVGVLSWHGTLDFKGLKIALIFCACICIL